MQNVKFIVAYDGTRYLGWQKTKMGPSIEDTLQTVLEQILQHPIALQASSRTDAGVHANGQVVNFLTSHLELEPNRLKISVNALLPKDIVVLDALKVDAPFHPTLNCIGKEYRYYICFGAVQLPQHRLYSWHYHYPLDLHAMKSALVHLLGTHDFSAFCNTKKNSHYSDYVRTIESIEIDSVGSNRLCIRVKGNHFLYKMVRNIVGTLVYVGHGKIEADQLGQILASGCRIHAGVTAPAHGLFLEKVEFLS